MDWLFDHHGDVGMSKSALDDAVDMAICHGHIEVARTLQARGDVIVRGEEPVKPSRTAVSASGAMRFVRKQL